MPSFSQSRLAIKPSLSFSLFAAFIFVLFLAGGSARADVSGQVIVRIAATFTMVLAILFGPRPKFTEIKAVWILLLASMLLPILQLTPLPPGVWQALPGRALFSQAATLAGEPQPWRPLSVVPGATINAVGSLLVPLATLLLLSQLTDDEHRQVPHVVIATIVTSMLIGLLQFSGLNIASPFGDNGPVDVSGFFNNRNHFALILAIGCAVAPTWALLSRRQQKWRAPLAFGLAILLVLVILASGSRTGIIVSVIGLGLGTFSAWRGIRSALYRYPRWVAPAAISTVLTTLIAAISASFIANRAVSVNRLLIVDQSQDLRSRAFPTVTKIFQTYFPAGSGYGSFDSVFRIHEPYALLSPEYFNHAHNDLIENAIDGGVAGLLLAVGMFAWWVAASFRTWRMGLEARNGIARAGSVAILLIVIASVVDYPARTPLVMAILIVAAVWLARNTAENGSTLPQSGGHL